MNITQNFSLNIAVRINVITWTQKDLSSTTEISNMNAIHNEYNSELLFKYCSENQCYYLDPKDLQSTTKISNMNVIHNDYKAEPLVQY